ncbi:hypothetical protein F511_20225 [Dorcoceras hygrometricum]|uniref:Uncharacterized protein n=1 Tax=Dorcoceras hygrometricum TaxID=472368 RepID=A0A2Z7AQK7_9LAMI|nr:hypothetical protein F511_20225 [Dorcoceras hygrometricum]
MDEIQKLKRKCIELECESLRNSCSKKLVKRLEEFTDDAGKRNDGSRVVSKEDDKSERNTEDVGVVRFDLCGDNSLYGSCDVDETGNDINLMVESMVNEIMNEVIKDNGGAIHGGKSLCLVDTTDEEKVTKFRSSIVDDVRARVDRKKKKKASMFVTPPSSTLDVRGEK